MFIQIPMYIKVILENRNTCHWYHNRDWTNWIWKIIGWLMLRSPTTNVNQPILKKSTVSSLFLLWIFHCFAFFWRSMQQNKFVLIWSLCANHVRFLSRTVMHGYYIRFPLWKCSISSSKKLIEEVIFLLNRYAQKTSQIRACTYPYLLAYYTKFWPILRQ